MRISLAQCLIATAFFAISLGWYKSHQQIVELKRLHAKRIDETVLGIGISQDARTTTLLAEAYQTSTEEQFENRMNNQLTWAVYRLYFFEKKVNNAEDEHGHAKYLAQQILKLLRCNDPSEFTTIARKNFGNDAETIESFPEYYDESSEDYQELAQFVRGSIDNKFVPSFVP